MATKGQTLRGDWPGLGLGPEAFRARIPVGFAGGEDLRRTSRGVWKLGALD